MQLRIFAILSVLFMGSVASLGQNEQAPILEKDLLYKDWTYKSIRTGDDVNLRNYTKGKKLTMIVYFAPWCPNWRFDAPRLQKFYEKYKDSGLGIIAVGLYDPVDSMKTSLEALKVTFPAVYESAERTAKQTSLHYQYRRSTGDLRGWGSPWYVMLTPKVMEEKGDVLTRHTHIINGEIVETEGEAFIRRTLGLPADPKMLSINDPKIDPCDPDGSVIGLKKPI